MAYCRWSSNDFQCDVYVYESDEGVAVNVASQRLVLPEGGVPPLPDIRAVDADEWLAADRARRDIFDQCERRPIDLSRDGESFYGLAHDEAADLLAELAAEGYNVPADVIDDLREESAMRR